MGKLLLLDGNSILNRAFYGTQNSFMKNREGQYTGAVFGFLNIFFKHLEEEKPEYTAVAFDLRAPTFRHQAYDQYKANRKGMPEELAGQLPLLKEILDAMGIARIEQEGYEADDIIGTLAKEAEADGTQCVILTGDRDSLQLISSEIHVKLCGTAHTDRYDTEAVQAKYGVLPPQLIEVKALMGDASDNIPGVPGVGEKTALALISQFGTLDGVYEHLDAITKPALRAKLEENKELAYLSRMLGKIDTAVPLQISLPQLNRRAYDTRTLYGLLDRLELKSMIKKLGLSLDGDAAAQPAGQDETGPDRLTQNPAASAEGQKTAALSLFDLADQSQPPADEAQRIGLAELQAVIETAKDPVLYIFCRWEGTALRAVELAAGSAAETEGAEEACLPEKKYRSDAPEQDLTLLKPLIENENLKKAVFDGKPLILWLLRRQCDFQGLWCDTAIAAYLLDATRKVERFEDVCRYFTGRQLPADVFALARSAGIAQQRIRENGLENLYRRVELPLVRVLAELEQSGFRVAPEVLREEGNALEARIQELTKEIYTLAGRPFNINSPKQLSEILFEDLGLKGKKKTKTGYATNQDVLESLMDQHLIIPLIIEYRQDTKLKSTYIDGLLTVIDPETGRVHSSFNQMVTATGRLSSTEPNLQNIPVRHALGRQIRKAFVPADSGHVLVDADYSQIELRILAHMSQDRGMLEAFRTNQDIHTITAAQVNHIPVQEVTPEMRSRAKAVNFGIVYGISEFGLARDLSISRQEAKRYINGYFTQYPDIKLFLEALVKAGKDLGYAETLLGRRRYLPELTAAKHTIRAFGERVAMNMPIQGTAADIIKIAMIRVRGALRDGGYRARLILQVHDELLVDTPREETEAVKQLLKQCMEEAYPLSVPLAVSVSVGEDWYSCK